MAKKPMATKAANSKAATLASAQANTLDRKKARLVRHLEKHPKDTQSSAGFKGTPRKKPYMKGTAPSPVYKLRHSVTGQPLEMPKFASVYAAKAA